MAGTVEENESNYPWPELWRRTKATTQGRYLRADPCRYRCYNSAVEKPSANLQFLYTGGIFTRSVVSYPVGEWLSLVEHLVRDQGVGGSNPLSPTISFQSLRILAYLESEPLVRFLWVPQRNSRFQQRLGVLGHRRLGHPIGGTHKNLLHATFERKSI
jgi:hypothetical protein